MTMLEVGFNVVNLNEAYGNGPPYYARTTNMDKWTDPLPVLAAIDTTTAIAIALFFCLCRGLYARCR